MLEPKMLLGFVMMVLLTVGANLMLKLGAVVPAAERIVFGIVGWKSLAGLTLFGCAGLLYAILLRWVPLNVAQAFTAAQFVGVVLAASFLLNEPISITRWASIGFIGFGILLVGLTARG